MVSCVAFVFMVLPLLVTSELQVGLFDDPPVTAISMLLPADCSTVNGTCLGIANVVVSTDTAFITIISTKYDYVALGISHDGKMGDDVVFACFKNETEDVNFRLGYNPGSPKFSGTKFVENMTNVTVTKQSLNDTNVVCEFKVESSTTAENSTFNINNGDEYYLLLAVGKYNKVSLIQIHEAKAPSPKSYIFGQKPAERAEFMKVVEKCVASNENCVPVSPTCLDGTTTDCPALAYVDYGENKTTFSLATSQNSYVALGFSEDNKMGGEVVVACVINDEGKVLLKVGNNPNGHALTELLPATTNVTLESSSSEDGDLVCQFVIEEETTAGNWTAKVVEETEYYLLLAYGEYNSTSSILNHHAGRTASENTFTFNAASVPILAATALLFLFSSTFL